MSECLPTVGGDDSQRDEDVHGEMDDYDAEEDVIDTYRSLIDAAEDDDGPVTEVLAVTILADEEAHRTEFRDFVEEYQDN